MGALNIREAALPYDLQAVRTLFVEYAESLDFSLCFQGFDDELAGLPGKYAPPAGRIWLAKTADGALAGCVAIRPIGEQDAEMKRLYVRPDFRDRALGKKLADHTVAFAREAGYAALRLDTIAETMGRQRKGSTSPWDSSKPRLTMTIRYPARLSTRLI